MENKKGFTLIELVLSVTLLSIVLIFMMAMLVDLKDKEKSNGADAKLLVNQAIISKTVNTEIISYGLESISACASMNCFVLSFGNGEERTLKLMSDNQTLFYGNEFTTEFIRTLPNGRKYSSIHYYLYGNLEILRISVGKIYRNEDYDIEIYNYMGNKTTNTGGYAASGIILQLDGHNNAGTGMHNAFSSQWMDLSGSGNNGILKEIDLTPTATSGWIENGITFDGSNDGIFLGDGLAGMFTYSSTIEITLSKAELNKRNVLFSNCTNANCVNIEIDASNKNKISMDSNSFSATSTNEVITNNNNITTLAYVFDKSKGMVTTYIDGAKGETFSSNVIADYFADLDGLWLGRDTTGADNFKGTIYSVRIYSYALSDAKLYTNASIDKKRFVKQYLYTTVTPFDKQLFDPEYSGLYKFELWGARGGNFGSWLGGEGGYTSGVIELNAGDKIYMYIGSHGSDSSEAGGNNGGGSLSGGQHAYGRPGGGATDIRILNGDWNEATALNSRIMIAGGGGGANHRSEGYGDGKGGVGGGLIGGNGETVNATNGYGHQYGTGGTQVQGGHTISIAGTAFGDSDILSAGFAIGGGPGQSGGGGGYYGGGQSGHGGAGGGSSYISGHTGCVAIKAEYDPTPLDTCDTGNQRANCSYHYSRKVFNYTVMIDGAGYNWTHEKGELTLMPNPLGGYFPAGHGNNGDGYIRVTYLGQSE